MHWLAKQPAFGKSREFEITTRSIGRNAIESTAGDLEEEDDECEQFTHGWYRSGLFASFVDFDSDAAGRRKKKVVFMPCLGTFLAFVNLRARLNCIFTCRRHAYHLLQWSSIASTCLHLIRNV